MSAITVAELAAVVELAGSPAARRQRQATLALARRFDPMANHELDTALATAFALD